MNNVIVVSSAARNDMKAVRPNDIRSLNDFNYQARVGINTHIPRTCLDVGVSKDPIILASLPIKILVTAAEKPAPIIIFLIINKF